MGTNNALKAVLYYFQEIELTEVYKWINPFVSCNSLPKSRHRYKCIVFKVILFVRDDYSCLHEFTTILLIIHIFSMNFDPPGSLFFT